jgi:hypothetical protein
MYNFFVCCLVKDKRHNFSLKLVVHGSPYDDRKVQLIDELHLINYVYVVGAHYRTGVGRGFQP